MIFAMNLIESVRRSAMKGYLNGNGYMGLVNGRYILFTSEAEYEEYMEEED